eukprot:6739468-Prymnesium_polylepis.1
MAVRGSLSLAGMPWFTGGSDCAECFGAAPLACDWNGTSGDGGRLSLRLFAVGREHGTWATPYGVGARARATKLAPANRL